MSIHVCKYLEVTKVTIDTEDVQTLGSCAYMSDSLLC